ncbi:FAD:protein FMN transferase [Rodentibacter caecimuris]|uniref:FAD:protein FMN transferase n=1 Tax=Rodentibacter caecimuris TaxID=1796644 RepID=A0ABX3L3J0_9PAST|nr:thiamine biosynthesis protein ApbE [Rodentibacter heylii]
MKKFTFLPRLILATIIFLLTACEQSIEMISLTGRTMGTSYHIKYIDDGKISQNPEQTHQQIQSLLKKINAQMSTYQKDSEISRFNQNREIDTPIPISSEFATVLEEAIRLNQLTEGALDITIGPIVNLWGFGPEKRAETQPTEEQLLERKAWIGLDKITLDKNKNSATLTKHIPQVYIDLSSIAKGFGVDQVAELLENLNIKNYMVEIGGEIRAKGNNIEGSPWRIAIEKPIDGGQRAVENVIKLENLAMATSGNYRIYFEENGKRFSHEINPKTGYPIEHHLASITVLAPSSMTADGLSTGLFVLGEEKALDIAEKYNIPVYLIIKDKAGFIVKMSSAFKQLTEK